MIDPEYALMAYADGELDAEAAREVERRLATDPQARATVEGFRRTTDLLRRSYDQRFFQAGPALRLRPRRLAGLRRHGRSLAACLALCLGGFAAGAAWRGADSPDPLDEVAEYHKVFSRESAHLVELPPDQIGDLAAWIGETSARGFQAPDLSGAGLRIAGGRMLVIDGERVGELMYTRARGLPVGLCVSRSSAAPEPLHVETRGDLRLAAWRHAGYAYVVVGELDSDAARNVAARIAAQSGI